MDGTKVINMLFGDSLPVENDPGFTGIWYGRIIDTHYDVSILDNAVLAENTNFQTVDVVWLEGKPFKSTNVPIPTFVSNLGYGYNYLPSINDIVISAFNPRQNPYIIGFKKQSPFRQLGKIDPTTGKQVLNSFGDPTLDGNIREEVQYPPLRWLEPGELSVRSRWFAENYFDKYGAVKTIVREQTEDASTRKSIPNRLWELTVGQTVFNESTSKIEQSDGKNVQVQLKGHKNGFLLNITADGDIEIQNNGNKVTISSQKIELVAANGDSVRIEGGKIYSGTSAQEPAVLGQTLTNFMNTITSIYNGHTHNYAPGPGTPTPTTPPSEPMVVQNFMSKKNLVE